MHVIKPLTSLTRAERRTLATTAADNGEPVHEACPYEPGTPEHQNFHDDYIERRFDLSTVYV